MAETKAKRDKKKQMGQFMTPIERCQEIVSGLEFKKTDKVLEPSFGCGNFIISIIERFLELYEGDIEHRLTRILNDNVFGVEMDPLLYEDCINNIKGKYGFMPESHNLVLSDYFLYNPTTDSGFDYIIGNPPFGGTIDPEYQDLMDKRYGKRKGNKIKKETYSFFMIKSVECLKPDGKLIFISSDTFLTIKTMKGLRMFLFDQGFNEIEKLDNFSEETDYPMIVLTHSKSDKRDHIVLDGIEIPYENMSLTSNFSWYIQKEYVRYFKGNKLDSYLIGTSGMTIGKNELFLREIREDGTILEEYDFTFFEDPITLEKEISKARNNKLSPGKTKEFTEMEAKGKTRRNVRIEKLESPKTIKLPHPDYCNYNKSSNEALYSMPKTVVYWKDEGDAVITFKKNGNWYLHGVGGKPYFKREGLTWQLISSSIKARYLPEGYILDSGAPIAVLKEGVEKKELLFIIGWLLTKKCNEILKNVINHTMNIQSKDIERLPYPFWVGQDEKNSAIALVKESINAKRKGMDIPSGFNEKIEVLYRYI
jgi:hypothetical protein